MSVATQNDSIERISVTQALELLQRATEDGREIPHAVTIVRDPNNPGRILSINATETQ